MTEDRTESQDPADSRTADRDGLGRYLAEAGRFPLLTADQEAELSQRTLRGDTQARDELINSNLRLVVSIAKKYTRPGVDLDELVSVGNLALAGTAERYDASKGLRFSTYARRSIETEIRRAAEKDGRYHQFPVVSDEDDSDEVELQDPTENQLSIDLRRKYGEDIEKRAEDLPPDQRRELRADLRREETGHASPAQTATLDIREMTGILWQHGLRWRDIRKPLRHIRPDSPRTARAERVVSLRGEHALIRVWSGTEEPGHIPARSAEIVAKEAPGVRKAAKTKRSELKAARRRALRRGAHVADLDAQIAGCTQVFDDIKDSGITTQNADPKHLAVRAAATELYVELTRHTRMRPLPNGKALQLITNLIAYYLPDFFDPGMDGREPFALDLEGNCLAIERVRKWVERADERPRWHSPLSFPLDVARALLYHYGTSLLVRELEVREGMATWDGSDSHGYRLPAGAYSAALLSENGAPALRPDGSPNLHLVFLAD